jgi:hypothetical protein
MMHCVKSSDKRRPTGTSGTKNAGTKSKHLRKLPVKQY